MMDSLSAMEGPYWLIVAGAILIVLGLVGLAFRKNKRAVINHGPADGKTTGPDHLESPR